ncbi:hypothetical protein B0H13DRAFT_2331611 [Mycena leptocephala]|nr:hypothetical protein B0H13DRAFT_2331611 [Mycena leptocephala]
MHSSIIKAAFLAALSAAVGAAEVTLWNGSANVSVTIDRAVEPISKRDSINCKGSSAYDLIVPGNTYNAGGSASGACSGACGVFVQSYDGTDGCSVSGSQIQTAFNDIRGDGCAKCGSYEFDNGCEVTIN